MNWFRRKKDKSEDASAQPTFRERVDGFWEWWSEESQRILESVDGDGGGSMQPEVSEIVGLLGASFGWVFGPAEEGEGHSFTLSPEGCPNRRYLTQFWHSRAPSLPGWTFYPSRQPSKEFGESSIRIGDTDLSAESLWITPSVDIENEEIDITVWSPTFADITNDQAMQILFLYLDEALGEEGTERWLGAIEIGDGKLDRSIPLTELPDHVDKVFRDHEWAKTREVWSNYQLKQSLGDFPRGDIFVGSTRNMKLVGAYFDAAGPVEEDPLKDSGAELMFLQLPRALFPEGEEVDFRAGIEDALEESFGADLGKITGGAMGTDAGYIDLILFDGQRSRDAIDETLAARGLADNYQLLPFTR